MRKWTAAEFRARLTSLGFTVNSFAHYARRDRRTIQRTAMGVSEQVTPNLVKKVTELEELYDQMLTDLEEQALDHNKTMYIPRQNKPVNKGELPPSWYLALAAELVQIHGTDIRIEWEP